MEEILKELIAITKARRDWQGFPHYLENIAPREEALDQKLWELNLPLEVGWCNDTMQYGLFPRNALSSGKSKE